MRSAPGIRLLCGTAFLALQRAAAPFWRCGGMGGRQAFTVCPPAPCYPAGPWRESPSPDWLPMLPSDETPSTPERARKTTGNEGIELHVRRMHRLDINRVWTFLKMVFRGVNRETVEFQRPRHKKRFIETYEDEGVEQLLFEIKRGDKSELAGYAEYSHEIGGTDSW